jgi:hypothetical protein
MRHLCLAFFILLSGLSGLDAEPKKYWVYFTDKGPLTKSYPSISERSMERRVKRTRPPFFDSTDIKVYKPYIDEIKKRGMAVENVSRWLNALSVTASFTNIQGLRDLTFVRDVRPVLTTQIPYPTRHPDLNKGIPFFLLRFDYGRSFTQNQQIRIVDAHQMGYSGQDVLVAVFDTGFNLNHEALHHLDVLASYDFIHDDSFVGYDSTQDTINQPHHGTQILSILAGFKSGELVGPAFSSQFILAKTEMANQEIIAEEDNWVAAAEWADSIGADIISASLGYNKWYQKEDLNGSIPAITRAADLAVQKGMVVVVAAGNEADDEWGTILAPADGDSVISVGAVDSRGIIAPFSSTGPSADGRIKPEVVAMGMSVRTVHNPLGEKTGRRYASINGTSASTPLVAGAAAILLSAFPDTEPMLIREALIQTADRADTPDNVYGYGLVNTVNALYYLGNPFPLIDTPETVAAYPNPFSADRGLIISFTLKEKKHITIRIFNSLGQIVAVLWDGQRLAGSNQHVTWYGRNLQGHRVTSGVYFIEFLSTKRIVQKVTLLN